MPPGCPALAGRLFTTEPPVKPLTLYVCMHVKLLKLCPTLCNPMDYSLPDSSVHGIFQARILESATIPSSGDLPNPWIKPVSPGSPAWAGGFFITKSTVKPLKSLYSYAEF